MREKEGEKSENFLYKKNFEEKKEKKEKKKKRQKPLEKILGKNTVNEGKCFCKKLL